MTEDEAQGLIADRFGRSACDRVATFLGRVATENTVQNLVSPATLDRMWSRHALDSAQLIMLAPEGWKTWMDVGTGGGFPGMVIALLAPERAVTMAEPRRKRAAFLESCVKEFALGNAIVIAAKVENLDVPADVISARAVGSVETIMREADGCATAGTTWLLPRGRSGRAELNALPYASRKMFHVEHSLTDPDSVILVRRGLR